jgi:hypothetical protein
MKSTRRSILKSGVAGLAAVGGTGEGLAQNVAGAPKAVISNNGKVQYDPNGTFSVEASVAVIADGFFLETSVTFYFYSFSTTDNIVRNVPPILEAIKAAGGPMLKQSDLLFVGFDSFFLG